MIAALRRFRGEHTEREWAALCAGAALIALAIAYAYVWLPVTRERDRLLASVPQLRAVAREMQRDAAELERLKGIDRKSPLDLKAAVEQTAIASGITPGAGEISQHGAESVRVGIASAQAAQGFAFVARLQSEHGVRAESLRMTAVGDGDRVRLDAVLVRKP